MNEEDEKADDNEMRELKKDGMLSALLMERSGSIIDSPL
mgnify:CR=1 FL=1